MQGNNAAYQSQGSGDDMNN